MSKKGLLFFVVSLVVILGFGILSYQQVRSNVRRPTPTPMLGRVTPGPAPTSDEIPEGLIPTPSHRTDFAPNVAREDKLSVLVRRIDGSYELLLFAPETSLSEIESHLSPLDSILIIGPPMSLMGHQPPTLAPDAFTHPDTGRSVQPTGSSPVGPTSVPPPTPSQ